MQIMLMVHTTNSHSSFAIPVDLTGRYNVTAGEWAIGNRPRTFISAIEVRPLGRSPIFVMLGDLVTENYEPLGYWQMRRALLERYFRERTWFRWLVEFEVCSTWVEDGFDLTDDRAKAMIEHDLSYSYGFETRARVLGRPSKRAVNICQGAKPNAKRDGWPKETL